MPKIIKNINEVLNLKGTYTPKANANAGGPKNIKKGKDFETTKILMIRDQLISIKGRWSKINTIKGLVVNVQYNCVLPKSSRISFLLRQFGKNDTQRIVGARFVKQHHNVSYYLEDRSIK